MWRRIWTMVVKDARTGSRDQLVTYMLLSPMLLGLLLALIMPILEDPQPAFAVTEELEAVHVEALAAHGSVEVLPDRAAVEARVRARDDVLGVIPSDDPERPELLVEGDEAETLRGLAGAILDHAARERAGEVMTRVELVAVGGATAELRLIAAALLAYCVVVIVGMMLGFAILEETSTQTAEVYDVSPLRFFEYLGAKLGLAALLSTVMVVPALALPLGLNIDWIAVELAILASLPFALCLGLCVGAFARDQLGAVALLKGLLPLWTSLPILGFVLPERWLWTQWPFANHWGVQALFAALSGEGGVVGPAGLALAAGLPVMVAVAILLRRKLGFCDQGAR